MDTGPTTSIIIVRDDIVMEVDEEITEDEGVGMYGDLVGVIVSIGVDIVEVIVGALEDICCETIGDVHTETLALDIAADDDPDALEHEDVAAGALGRAAELSEVSATVDFSTSTDTKLSTVLASVNSAELGLLYVSAPPASSGGGGTSLDVR